MRHRLHVLGLPWTETTRTYSTCAYTEKARKFCTMMTAAGYEVILYAGEENEAVCAEHVTLVTRGERVGWFGEWDANNLFERIDWNPASPWWETFLRRATDAIRERAEPRDVLCLLTRAQDSVAAALPALMPVEWAVGYEGIRLTPYESKTPAVRIFESYAWMHYLYGKWGIADGCAFDAVIPNFFDRADFLPETRPADDYLLFIGRLVLRKGPHVAAQIAERAGMRLLVAGGGAVETYSPNRAERRKGAVARISAPEVTITGANVEYVGPVGVDERAELMAGAAATIVPTLYVEPFGGVAVEAMMAGSPVVASDFGAFTETVAPGISGYRFRTLAEGARAVEKAVALDRDAVRDYARARYSLEAVGPLFDDAFRRLDTLWGDGWYATEEAAA